MARSRLVYVWAGTLHICVLLSLVAFFYFPVYLDSRAAVQPQSRLPWLPLLLAGILGPVVLGFAHGASTLLGVGRGAAAFLRSAVSCASLWCVLLSWRPTGRVVWDLGAGAAGLLYFIYCVVSGLAAYSLGTGNRGLGYVTGCGQILESGLGMPPTAAGFQTASLYRYARHPVEGLVMVSCWLTPLMTLDRVCWAVVVSILAIVHVQLRERELVRDFGPSFGAYQARVPKWIPTLH